MRLLVPHTEMQSGADAVPSLRFPLTAQLLIVPYPWCFLRHHTVPILLGRLVCFLQPVHRKLAGAYAAARMHSSSSPAGALGPGPPTGPPRRLRHSDAQPAQAQLGPHPPPRGWLPARYYD
jgi:hypothetical protein